MAKIPIVYRKSSPNIVTYSFTDIIEGVGAQDFYPCTGELDTGEEYSLITATLPSWDIEIEAETDEIRNYDSSEFNAPMNIKGTAFFSGHIYQENAASSGYVEAQLLRWDGTASYAISDVVKHDSITTATTEEVVFLKLPCTETRIKKGEQIRLRIKVHGTNGNYVYFGVSPTNQTSSSGKLTATTCTLRIPFEIDQ